MTTAGRMSAQQRREQLIELSAEEFAHAGLHGTSTETLARRAFGRLVDGMDEAAGERTGRDALAAMGLFYDRALADRTGLLVQLQAFAASGDDEMRDAVREQMAHMWTAVAGRTGLPRVAVKTFLAYGMLLNTAAALRVSEVDADWADGIRTRIQAGLFDHLTGQANR